MKNKHVHIWNCGIDVSVARCDCGEVIHAKEIERRLSATERLSAAWATMAASFIYSEYSHKGWEERQADAYRSYKDCLAYATALADKEKPR